MLDVQPLSDVLLDFISNNVGEVNVASPTTKRFTFSNWNTPQIITLASVDEFFIDGSQVVSITASINAASNAGFLGVASQTVSITNADNDVASITLIPVDNLTSEAGDTGSFYLVLTAIPTAHVDIGIRSLVPSEALPAVNTISFTPANWNVPQLVTINGINDSPPFSDGSQTVTIVTENVSSTDINFSSITNANTPKYVVMNQDDDAPGVLINVVDNNFKTSESGSTVTVLFELLSQPAGGSNVTIPLSLGVSSDEMTLSTSTISISSVHWNQPSQNQFILKGVDDSIIDGTQIVRLITGDPSSTDTPYNNLTATDVADVDLYNLDNDSAGLMITQPQAVSENEVQQHLLWHYKPVFDHDNTTNSCY